MSCASALRHCRTCCFDAVAGLRRFSPPPTASPAVRFSADGESPIVRDADLVVDASGRGTLTLALLDALGWGSPDVTEIGVDIAYATLSFRCRRIPRPAGNSA